MAFKAIWLIKSFQLWAQPLQYGVLLPMTNQIVYPNFKKSLAFASNFFVNNSSRRSSRCPRTISLDDRDYNHSDFPAELGKRLLLDVTRGWNMLLNKKSQAPAYGGFLFGKEMFLLTITKMFLFIHDVRTHIIIMFKPWTPQMYRYLKLSIRGATHSIDFCTYTGTPA